MSESNSQSGELSEMASTMVLEALEALKNALKEAHPTKCLGCYSGLSKVLDESASRPEDAEYMLKKWVHQVRVQQTLLNCTDCRLPVWD